MGVGVDTITIRPAPTKTKEDLVSNIRQAITWNDREISTYEKMIRGYELCLAAYKFDRLEALIHLELRKLKDAVLKRELKKLTEG